MFIVYVFNQSGAKVKGLLCVIAENDIIPLVATHVTVAWSVCMCVVCRTQRWTRVGSGRGLESRQIWRVGSGRNF